MYKPFMTLPGHGYKKEQVREYVCRAIAGEPDRSHNIIERDLSSTFKRYHEMPYGNISQKDIMRIGDELDAMGDQGQVWMFQRHELFKMIGRVSYPGKSKIDLATTTAYINGRPRRVYKAIVCGFKLYDALGYPGLDIIRAHHYDVHMSAYGHIIIHNNFKVLHVINMNNFSCIEDSIKSNKYLRIRPGGGLHLFGFGEADLRKIVYKVIGGKRSPDVYPKDGNPLNIHLDNLSDEAVYRESYRPIMTEDELIERFEFRKSVTFNGDKTLLPKALDEKDLFEFNIKIEEDEKNTNVYIRGGRFVCERAKKINWDIKDMKVRFRSSHYVDLKKTVPDDSDLSLPEPENPPLKDKNLRLNEIWMRIIKDLARENHMTMMGFLRHIIKYYVMTYHKEGALIRAYHIPTGGKLAVPSGEDMKKISESPFIKKRWEDYDKYKQEFVEKNAEQDELFARSMREKYAEERQEKLGTPLFKEDAPAKTEDTPAPSTDKDWEEPSILNGAPRGGGDGIAPMIIEPPNNKDVNDFPPADPVMDDFEAFLQEVGEESKDEAKNIEGAGEKAVGDGGEVEGAGEESKKPEKNIYFANDGTITSWKGDIERMDWDEKIDPDEAEDADEVERKEMEEKIARGEIKP